MRVAAETHEAERSRTLAPVAIPPGPSAGVWSQTISLHRDPLGFLSTARAEHGDVFSVRLLTARPLVIVADPDQVEMLLGADAELAHAGEGRRRILPFASPRSAFGADAEQHRAARQRLAPAFSAEAIEARREQMTQIAARQAAAWPRGRPFRLLARMRDVADEIFVRLVLGVRDDEIAGSLIAAMRRMLRTPGNPPITLPGPGDGAMGALGQKLFERRQAPLARELARAVEARRGEAGGTEGVLGLMTAKPGLSTSEIVDELTSLLMAAQEPPAIALARVLERLAGNDDLARDFLAAPRGEAASFIVRETLRLTPAASAAIRRTTGPFSLGEWALPRGTTVMVPTTLLHRDVRAYDDPNSFEPRRWIGEPPPAFYFPFGGGARRCIGEPLAHAEIETVIPAVLERLQLSPLSSQPEPMVQRATVLAPKRGLLVRAA
jgi:cytochrome P450 family 135